MNKVSGRRRTFESDADAVCSVETGVVLRRREYVSLRIGLVQIRVRNDSDPVVVGVVRKAVLLEVDVEDVDRVDGEDAGKERRAVVRQLDAMVVVRVAAGAGQESEVAQLRLLAGSCTSPVASSQVKSGAINIEKSEGVGPGEVMCPPQLGSGGLPPEK